MKTPYASDDSLALNHIGFRTRIKFDGQCLKQDKVIFNHKTVVNIYILLEINVWLFKEITNFTLGAVN